MTLPTSRERAISATFAMKPSLLEQAKRLADKRQVTVSELVRDLIAKDIAEEGRAA